MRNGDIVTYTAPSTPSTTVLSFTVRTVGAGRPGRVTIRVQAIPP